MCVCVHIAKRLRRRVLCCLRNSLFCFNPSMAHWGEILCQFDTYWQLLIIICGLTLLLINGFTLVPSSHQHTSHLIVLCATRYLKIIYKYHFVNFNPFVDYSCRYQQAAFQPNPFDYSCIYQQAVFQPNPFWVTVSYWKLRPIPISPFLDPVRYFCSTLSRLFLDPIVLPVEKVFSFFFAKLFYTHTHISERDRDTCLK